MNRTTGLQGLLLMGVAALLLLGGDDFFRFIGAMLLILGAILWVIGNILSCKKEKEQDNETRCRKCGYILRGISEPRCPECGERI